MEPMQDTREINGRNSDTFARDRLASIATALCPDPRTPDRIQYARGLLAWVMEEPDVHARYARTKGIEQAYQAHRQDREDRRIPIQITLADFLILADSYAAFIGSTS